MKKKINKPVHPIVDKLIKIRNDRRLNQTEFADLVGIDSATYNKIESGNLKLSLDRLSNIAERLQLREIDIYTYPDVFVEVKQIDNSIKTQITIELKEELKMKILEIVFGNKNLQILNK